MLFQILLEPRKFKYSDTASIVEYFDLCLSIR